MPNKELIESNMRGSVISMLDDIIKMENEFCVKGYKENGLESIRSYHNEPTENLKKFLNAFTDNYYDDFDYYQLDDIVIEIDTNYNILVSCWNDNYEQVNDTVLIKSFNNIDFFKVMMIGLMEA